MQIIQAIPLLDPNRSQRDSSYAHYEQKWLKSTKMYNNENWDTFAHFWSQITLFLTYIKFKLETVTFSNANYSSHAIIEPK